jgi:hypothetical protein
MTPGMRTAWHPSVRGVLVGAAVGGIGRGLLVALHLPQLNDATFSVVLVGAAIGAGIGGLAGLVGRVGLGAIVGAGLALLVFAITWPVLVLFELMGVGTTSSIVAVAIGAVSGLAGGAAAAGTTPPRAAAGERIGIASQGEKR